MAGGGSSEDRRRRPTSRCHGDLRDDEPEEGEVGVPGYHSDVDTEEYYNRHGCSSSDSDETVSDSNAAACSVVPASCYGEATSPPSVAASSNGGASWPAAALPCPQALTWAWASNLARSRNPPGPNQAHRPPGRSWPSDLIRRLAVAFAGSKRAPSLEP